ncbi:MAG: IS1634 family transposase [Candidatus Wallbacteria bacterium]|nr:IS1634 family transposase [Candidatus Wallbacteria bacterium]
MARRLEDIALDEDGAPEYPTHAFGAVYVLQVLWQELELDSLLKRKFSSARQPQALERAVFAMVAHLATETGSKRACWREWLAQKVDVSGTRDLKLSRFYEAMDALEAVNEEVQYAVFDRAVGLLNSELDLVFYYDTTSVYWEIEEEDEGRVWKRPPRDPEPLRMRGHSKDSRPDAPQVVIAMGVTKDGIPVRSWVFPGNTVDVKTIEQVKLDLNAWKLRRFVLVGDRGMISDENMRTLTGGGGGYVLGVPMRRGEKEATAALERPGRYRKVKDNLRVKEVWYPAKGVEGARRFVICFNPEEAKRDFKQREDLLERLKAELTALERMKRGERRNRVHELMSHKSYKRYLRELSGNRLRISKRAVEAEARLDGKYLITTSDPNLSAEELALGYKHLQQIERAWRSMKDEFELGPVRHYAPRRIRAHVRLAQLALTLTRLVEKRSAMTWAEARLVLDRVHSAQLGPDLLGTTPTPYATEQLLSKLQIPKIPRLMPFSSHSAGRPTAKS